LVGGEGPRAPLSPTNFVARTACAGPQLHDEDEDGDGGDLLLKGIGDGK